MLKGSILQKLEAKHKDSNTPLNLGVYYKNTLVALCHALEDFILESKSSPITIAAFQEGKWYLKEAERYGEIAEKASHITIMAAPKTGWEKHPTSQRDNVSLISLPSDDPVSQEWHLMILSPEYTAMVLCQELSPEDYGVQGQPENDLERKFYGFWTFEPDLVWEAVEIAIAHIGNYDSSLQQSLTQQLWAMKADFNQQPSKQIGRVVERVVQYLHTSHETLSQPSIEEGSYLPSMEALDNNLVSNELQAFLRLAQIEDRADIHNPMAASEVAALTEAMGQLLDLPAWQMKRLRLASFLHRLVPSLGIIKTSPDSAPCCQLVPGIQALRAMPRVRAIAQIITHQGEHWDGSGTPGGLDHDTIPLEARMIALVAHFQERVNSLRMSGDKTRETVLSREETLSQALGECQEKAGTVFDPKLVETLSILVMGMQQGMDLQATQPKIASGIWLLNPQDEKVVSVSSV